MGWWPKSDIFFERDIIDVFLLNDTYNSEIPRNKIHFSILIFGANIGVVTIWKLVYKTHVLKGKRAKNAKNHIFVQKKMVPNRPFIGAEASGRFLKKNGRKSIVYYVTYETVAGRSAGRIVICPQCGSKFK